MMHRAPTALTLLNSEAPAAETEGLISIKSPAAPERMVGARTSQEDVMSNERIEGATQKAIGAIKQAMGKAVGDPKLQAEGLADKVVGTAKETLGKAKDAIDRAKH